MNECVRVAAFLQARMSSTRLPGKVLRPLAGAPALQRQIERVRRAPNIDRLVVVTSTEAGDDAIVALCAQLGVPCFRGSLTDVLGRFLAALDAWPCEHVVRLTGDCPLADWRVIAHVVDEHLACAADYTANTIERGVPDGLDVEAVRADVLRRIGPLADQPADREHVTWYINRNPQAFRRHSVRAEPDRSRLRWTLDTPVDYAFIGAVYDALWPTNPDFSADDIAAWQAAHPEVPGGVA